MEMRAKAHRISDSQKDAAYVGMKKNDDRVVDDAEQ
jgi:hypothetical protein